MERKFGQPREPHEHCYRQNSLFTAAVRGGLILAKQSYGFVIFLSHVKVRDRTALVLGAHTPWRENKTSQDDVTLNPPT